MSKRPVKDKKIGRLRKALRNTPTSYIDLTEYLRDRGYATSRKKANAMLAAGKVKVESHAIGRIEVPDPEKRGQKKWVARPLVDAKFRDRIMVLT